MTGLLFLPEAATGILAFVLFFMTLARKETLDKVLKPFMLFSAFVILSACLYRLTAAGALFGGTYQVDLLSQGFKAVIALCFLFTVLFSGESVSIPENRRLEYFFFLFAGTAGMMMLTSAMDILTLYVSLELSSYSLYLLSALRRDARVAEASLKYLILGAAASGLFLWGFSLIAGLAGSISLVEIAVQAPLLALQPAFSLGIVLLSFALLFKLSSFPVHFWAPDVYECASTPVTNFIATASKAAAVAVFIRLFNVFGVSANFAMILGVIAFSAMTLGNCVALVQKDVKRLLAYSSIAQAGYLLLGLMAGSFEGYSSTFFYAFAYVLMNTGAFLAVLFVAKAIRHDNPQIEHFDGLAERSPFLSLILLLSLLSLAGIPPLIGFTGKWILFSAAMEKGHWFLVLWAVINSVISLFYYLTIVKHAYLEKPKTAEPIPLSLPYRVLGLGLFSALVFIGVYPAPFVSFARQAVSFMIFS